MNVISRTIVDEWTIVNQWKSVDNHGLWEVIVDLVNLIDYRQQLDYRGFLWISGLSRTAVGKCSAVDDHNLSWIIMNLWMIVGYRGLKDYRGLLWD